MTGNTIFQDAKNIWKLNDIKQLETYADVVQHNFNAGHYRETRVALIQVRDQSLMLLQADSFIQDDETPKQIKDRIGFKSNLVPTPVNLRCDNCGSWVREIWACTTNLTNSIWMLCRKHEEAMAAGEVWW